MLNKRKIATIAIHERKLNLIRRTHLQRTKKRAIPYPSCTSDKENITRTSFYVGKNRYLSVAKKLSITVHCSDCTICTKCQYEHPVITSVVDTLGVLTNVCHYILVNNKRATLFPQTDLTPQYTSVVM